MAQVYVTGPCDIWVGPNSSSGGRSGGSAQFLGHSERGPAIQIRDSFSPVYVDLGGPKVPFDMIYDGEDAIVSCELTRFNENVYETIADIAALQAPGFNDPGEIGTLMLQEGSTYPLWIHFPYSAKVAYQNPASGAMPAGYRFPAAYLQQDSLPALGTTARKMHLVWHCLRQFTVGFSNAEGYGKFTLYDFNMSALGPIN